MFDDDDGVPADAPTKWLLGVAGPCLIGLYGASKLLFPYVTLRFRYHSRLHLTGFDARLFGCMVIAIALFMHAHYFWAHVERLAGYSSLLKPISVLSGIALFAVILIRNISPF